MKIIIFDTKTGGHHMEYIHHLYEMSCTMLDIDFVFVLPETFKEKKDIFEWPKSKNISFDYLKELNYNGEKSIFKLLLSSWNICLTLRKYIKKHKATHAFCIELISLYPFAQMILPNKLELSGIVYRIYLHTEKKDTRIKRVINKSKFWVMARGSVFKKILLLNDEDSARTLNNRYNVKKFVGIPDPFIPIPEEECFNFRNHYSIPQDAIILAHFGALDKRKGTLDILEAMQLLNHEKREKYWFVFAGCVSESFKTTFYEKYNKLKENYHIIIKDEFCSYAYIGSLCRACNAILAPYHETCLSSGMLGYAAQFGKPVIAPSEGLIGTLVRKYSLGYTIKDLYPSTITEGIEIVTKNHLPVSRNYLNKNDVSSFISYIRNVF